MHFNKSRSRKYLKHIILVSLLFLVCVFFSLKLVIPILIENVVTGYTSSKNVDIKITKLKFNTKDGIIGEDLYLSDSDAGINNKPLKIKKIQVLPDYFASLKKRSFIVDKIKIGSSSLDFTGNLQEELKKLFTPVGEKEEDDEQKPEKFSVKNIKIDDLRFIIDIDYELEITDLILTVGDISEKGKRINVKGLLKQGQSENYSEILGKIDLNNTEKNLKIDFKLDELANIYNSDLINIPKDLDLFLSSVVDFSDHISSDGNLRLRYSNNLNIITRPDFGNYEYSFDYIADSKKLLINSSKLTILDILSLDSRGEVDDLGNRSIFKIDSDLKVTDASFLPGWIKGMEDAELSADLKTEKLILTGSKENDDIRIEASGEIKDLSFSKVNFDKEVRGFETEFYLIKYFSSNYPYDIEARGSMRSEYVEAKTIPVRNLESKYRVTLTGTDIAARLNEVRMNVFGGEAKGFLNYYLKDADRSIDSEITAENLKIDQTNNSILKVPLNGNFDHVNLVINSDKKNEYILDIDFQAENFNLDFENNNSITASSLRSIDNLLLKISGSEPTKVEIKSDEISFKEIKYRFFESKSGILNDLDFNLESNSNWSADLGINGADIRLEGYELSFVDYNTSINIKNDESIVVKGQLLSSEGRYRNYKLQKYTGKFNFTEQILTLYDSEIKNDYFDDLKAKYLNLKLPPDDKKKFYISARNISASRADIGFSADIDKLDLEFNPAAETGMDYRGKVYAGDVKIADNVADSLAFSLESVNRNVRIYDLKSDYLGGEIRAYADINFLNNPPDFSGNIDFLKPKFNYSEINLIPKKANINFSGNIYGRDLNAKANLYIDKLELEKNGFSSVFDAGMEMKVLNETIYLENGLISNEGLEKIKFEGELNNYLNTDRSLKFSFGDMPLSLVKEILYPVMPFEVQEGELSGNVRAQANINQFFEQELNWNGKLFIEDASFDGLISFTEFSINGINGVMTLKNKSISRNPLLELMKNGLEINSNTAGDYKEKMERSREMTNMDYLSIKSLNYGFLKFSDIQSLFEINKTSINLDFLSADIYRGQILGSGYFDYTGQDKKYNLTFMLDDMSLESISDSIPSIKNYITGRFDGLFWINMGKKGIWTMNGPFSIWAKKSDKEELTIGRALLERIGAKSRFFTGSSRRYDKGRISGYINEGFMTFKEFEISNSILGYNDLKIVVDKKKNSISVKHLLSVIREISKRASAGGVKVDFSDDNNKEGESNEN